MEDIFVTMNEKQHRFETNIGDDMGYLDYRWYQGDIAFIDTSFRRPARVRTF